MITFYQFYEAAENESREAVGQQFYDDLKSLQPENVIEKYRESNPWGDPKEWYKYEQKQAQRFGYDFRRYLATEKKALPIIDQLKHLWKIVDGISQTMNNLSRLFYKDVTEIKADINDYNALTSEIQRAMNTPLGKSDELQKVLELIKYSVDEMFRLMANPEMMKWNLSLMSAPINRESYKLKAAWRQAHSIIHDLTDRIREVAWERPEWLRGGNMYSTYLFDKALKLGQEFGIS